jgi:hypothetical protein
MASQISVFEYISILISIILGLVITQLLSSFSDLLYDFKRVKFYWPHSIWIFFILFLQIQDWFITYQLKDKAVWQLSELMFLLLYPITLFTTAKMLLPTHEKEERFDMKSYFMSQSQIIFIMLLISIALSILFNVLLLKQNLIEQSVLLIFFTVISYVVLAESKSDRLHKILSATVIIASLIAALFQKEVWVIR